MIKLVNDGLQTEYERFVRNFNLIDQLYRNQGISPKIMIAVLNCQMEEVYAFILDNPKNRYSIKAKDLYKDMADYVKELKQDLNY